jgi:hypothetical protein
MCSRDEILQMWTEKSFSIVIKNLENLWMVCLSCKEVVLL